MAGKFFRRPRHRGFIKGFYASKIENHSDKRVRKLRIHSEILREGVRADIGRKRRVRLMGKEKRLYYRRLSRLAKRRTQL